MRLSEETTTIQVNGQNVNVSVTIDMEYDDEPIDGSFDFGEEKANAEYLADFASGKLTSVNMLVSATATDLGVTGHDSLNACHLVSRLLDEQARETVRDHEMIQIALAELSKKIVATSEKWAKFSKGEK